MLHIYRYFPVTNSKPKRRGANPEVLRETSGASFEDFGRVSPGREGMIRGWFGKGHGINEHLILVQGLFCFVFVSGNRALSPKYAIALKEIRAKVKHPASAGRVLLETIMGDVKYELSFATEEIAREFADEVRIQHSVAAEEVIRQRIGHEDHLTTLASSVLYAGAVARDLSQV
jgi:hypothetical protein